MIPSLLSRCIAAGLVASLGLRSQVVGSNGPLVGLPIAVSPVAGTRDKAGATLSERKIYHKKAGVGAPGIVGGPLQTNTPDYSFDKIFDAGGGTSYDVHLGSMSTGLDYIATDSTNRYAAVTKGWNVIAFTVSSSTVGAAGSIVAREASAMDGAAADVFSYGMQGSALPSAYVGTVQRALDSTEIEYYFPGNTTTPPRKGQIATLDAGLPLYGLDPAIRNRLQGSASGTLGKFYFTITKPTLSKAPSSWWASTAPSAATILVDDWSVSTRKWSGPTVFLTHASLGLAQQDSIDSLSVDPGGSKVLFSLTSSSPSAATQSQLRYVSLTPTSVSVYDYEYKTGFAATQVITDWGLEAGADIGEMCILDPRLYSMINQVPGPEFGKAPWSGPSASPYDPPIPVMLSAAIYRSSDGSGNPVLDSWMVGWPPTGPGGSAAYNIEIPPKGSHKFLSFPVSRNPPPPPYPGDPVRFRMSIPAPYNTALYGIELRSIWVAVNGTLTAIDSSYMLTITL